MPEIELTIDELVLHGFSPHDRGRIGDAVHAELARLLGALGAEGHARLADLGRVATIDAGSFAVAPQSTAQGIGAGIAQQIVGGAAGGNR